ncbi:hypothetical protein FB567DRAFT_204121 [Paraphoma chrysanthemicola]|uniref:Uncharacterized protein n=1 Tax=Paraphoma chrysanthemicola TaxID=798071 RepID=A0A8K0VT24_9PLEO|nr:hypothetical protein FB567DRAFT_204121 [Paraphoma chrysanthemicola]
MSTPSTSFFSFGTEDSFISKSFQGLKYRNLPTPLQDLLRSSTIADLYWATLGSTPNSWLLSFKDNTGTNTLRWGSSTPQRLQTILAKTWHSPHLRAFLGPDDSFIIWHPDLIRWANLPTSLEDAIQAWLTPSGWRVGPPRIVTWGPEGAFFAMSEYGNVIYRFGDEDAWSIYQETIEEWKAEKGFLWSELAFITLDPAITDQFVAIRKDGTWAGSIDDINEDALEGFAMNFFAKAKGKHKSKPSTSGTNGYVPDTGPGTRDAKPDAATQILYEKWSLETATLFANANAAIGGSKAKTPRKLQVRSQSSTSSSGQSQSPNPPPHPTRTSSNTARLLSTFPYLPATITTCVLPSCVILKSDTDGIHACQHDVERLLRASGLYSYEWLRQERLRWHPDRFGRLCSEEWREHGKRMAGEMFKLIHGLMEELRGAEGAVG